MHGKNDCVEISKNLVTDLDTDLKIVLLERQNNFVGNSSMISNKKILLIYIQKNVLIILIRHLW